MLVSVTPGPGFNAVKITSLLPAGCIGLVIDCSYVPSSEGVDQHNEFEMPERLKVKVDAPSYATFSFG